MLKMKNTRGFTLVEVLVALLVLGVGLLGVAGLQSATLGLNHGSYLRSQATVLAQDMVDRMRANPRATANGDYDEAGAGASTATCEQAAGCTTQQMAAHDIAEWQAALGNELPDGEGVVCIDSTPRDGDGPAAVDNACDGAGDVRVIKIWWYSKDEDVTTRFVTEVRPL